ncbi:hypothetical protein CMV_000272 [Castanea mollissima]|uniref:Uncharacterized protein n=1 Tax=Castanea mollissima TaxID=60419 RepID=A0A8J4VZ36_9ROSI|nr:hypothetical protein CMV_000272 [Castanea mollissima]
MLIFSPLLPRSFVFFFLPDHQRVPANSPARKRNRLFSSSSILFELRFSLFAFRFSLFAFYTILLTPSLSPYLDLFVSFQIWLFRVRF